MFVFLVVLGVLLIVGGWYSHKSSQRNKEIQWDWKALSIDSLVFSPMDKDFLWGTATAAFQVEGNNAPSNWSNWENETDKKGNPRIHGGQRTGDACDHFNKYPEDIAGMANDLECNSYRFSVAWSRIEPEEGVFNDEAIAHYDRVIDACLANGVTPMLTLHHFTHPLWFEKKGSFEKEENIAYFERFAEVVFRAYSAKVKYWCTHNECGPFATMGWGIGAFPPGKKSIQMVGQILLNLMRSHSRVYRRLKSLPNGKDVQIGLVKNIFQFDPYHRWNPIHWLMCNTLDKVYNESIIQAVKTGVFRIRIPGILNINENLPDLKLATDFIGLNYYSNLLISLTRALNPFKPLKRPHQIQTDFPYASYPEGFYRAINRISTLRKPIFITENGIPDNRDDRREDWIRRYIYAMRVAMNGGADIRGFQYWSLMDNFEWVEGYSMRFGLYEVDFNTQVRKLRKSAELYKKIIIATTKSQ